MRLSLGHKLTGAFLVLVGLLVAVAVISIRSLEAIARQADAVAEIFQEHDLFLELQLAISQALEPSLAAGPAREHQEGTIEEIRSRSEALERSLRRDGLDPKEEELLEALNSGIESIRARAGRPMGGRGEQAALAAHALFSQMDQFHQLHAQRVAGVLELATKSKTRATRELLASATSAALLGLASGVLLTRTITRPLAQLQRGAEAIGAGNLDVQVKVTTSDEVGRLGEAFNRMAEQLRESYLTLEQKVAQRTAELARINRELEEAHQARQELLAKVISAQEEERRRIARELHDEASQAIATLIVNLEFLEGTLPEKEAQLAERLRRLRGIATQTLDEIHKIIFNLRPRVLDDLGLVPAVSGYLESHLPPLHIAYDLDVHGLDQRLPATVETAVFRIIQEAITNVIKHAHADHVRVLLDFDGSLLVVFVEDDGRGFDTGEVLGPGASRRGMGLLGIRERAALLGGRFSIHSRPGCGTRLYVEIPVQVGVNAHVRLAV